MMNINHRGRRNHGNPGKNDVGFVFVFVRCFERNSFQRKTAESNSSNSSGSFKGFFIKMIYALLDIERLAGSVILRAFIVH